MSIQQGDDIDKAPLLSNGTSSINAYEPETHFRVRKPRCSFYMEPAIMLSGIAGFPLMLISQQFIYKKIINDLSGGFDNITSPGNVSMCDRNASTDDPGTLLRDEAQSASAHFSLYLSVVTTIPALFVALFLGGYSDKAGRKYAMVPPLIGEMFQALSYALVIWLDLPKEWLFLGAFLNGLGGYYTTLLLGCFSYIADITTKEERAFRITIIEFSMFSTAVVTSIGFGYWIQNAGFLYPVLFVLIGKTIVVLYVIFVVPETIIKQENVKFFSLKHIENTPKLIVRGSNGTPSWKVQILLVSMLITLCPGVGNNVDTLFYMNTPLCWGSVLIGYYAAVYIVAGSIISLSFSKLLKRCLSDAVVTAMAGVISMAYVIYKGFAVNTLMMFLGPLVGGFGLLYIPYMRSLLSKHVRPEEQGAIFAAIAILELICSLMGNVIFNNIYAATQHIKTGFVFDTMAVFYFVGFLLILAYIVKSKREDGGLEIVHVQEADISKSNDTDT